MPTDEARLGTFMLCIIAVRLRMKCARERVSFPRICYLSKRRLAVDSSGLFLLSGIAASLLYTLEHGYGSGVYPREALGCVNIRAGSLVAGVFTNGPGFLDS